MASLELKLQGKFFHKPIAFEFYLGYWEGTPKPGSSLGPQVLFPLCFGIGLGYRLHRSITGRQRYSPATEANGRLSRAELGTGATEICAPDGRRNRVLGQQTLLRGVAI